MLGILPTTKTKPASFSIAVLISSSFAWIPLARICLSVSFLALEIKSKDPPQRESVCIEIISPNLLAKLNKLSQLSFAVEIGYICEDTIKLLIRKAASHEKALENFEAKAAPLGVPQDAELGGKEKPAGDIQEDKEESKEENKNEWEVSIWITFEG